MTGPGASREPRQSRTQQPGPPARPCSRTAPADSTHPAPAGPHPEPRSTPGPLCFERAWPSAGGGHRSERTARAPAQAHARSRLRGMCRASLPASRCAEPSTCLCRSLAATPSSRRLGSTCWVSESARGATSAPPLRSTPGPQAPGPRPRGLGSGREPPWDPGPEKWGLRLLWSHEDPAPANTTL